MDHESARFLFTRVLSNLLWQVPTLLVFLTGLVAALVCWRQYPRPSLMVAISTVAMFVISVANAFSGPYLIYLQETGKLANEGIGLINGVVGLGFSILHAAALSLLLIAIFAGQKITSSSKDIVPQGARRISPPRYIGSVAGGLILGAPLSLAGVVVFWTGAYINADDTVLAISAALFAVSLLPLFWAFITYLILMHKAWACIQDGHARTTPGKAVGFMFIPLFNFYWAFRAIPGFADDYNAYLLRAKISAPPLGRGILQTQVILQLIGIVPVVGVIPWLASVPIQCIAVAKICEAINALPETVTSPLLVESPVI